MAAHRRIARPVLDPGAIAARNEALVSMLRFIRYKVTKMCRVRHELYRHYEDLVQEVAVRFCDYWHTYVAREGAHLRQFVHLTARRIAGEAACRLWREVKMQAAKKAWGVWRENYEPEPEPAPDEVAKVHDALRHLAPHYREVIVLRYGLADGVHRPFHELAGGLGKSMQRASQIEQAALAKLKKVLDDPDRDDAA